MSPVNIMRHTPLWSATYVTLAAGGMYVTLGSGHVDFLCFYLSLVDLVDCTDLRCLATLYAG